MITFKVTTARLSEVLDHCTQSNLNHPISLFIDSTYSDSSFVDHLF